MSVTGLLYSVNVMRNAENADFAVQDRESNAEEGRIPQVALQMLDNLAVDFAKRNADADIEIDQAHVQVVFSASKVKFRGEPIFQKLFAKRRPQFNMQFATPLSLTFVVHVMHKIQAINLYSGILPTNPKCTGSGATTGNLRFPHMLNAIYQAIQAGTIRSDQSTNICIVGTGIVKGEKLITTIPPVAEFYALFPQAHFLFLDKDPVILQALQEQIGIGALFYDPTTLKMRLKGGNALVDDARYAACFKAIRNSMVAATNNHEDAERTFNEPERNKNLALKVGQGQMEVRKFDIVSEDGFKDTDCHFDVIVATNSLSFALFNCIPNDDEISVTTLAAFLNILVQLKEGGILYVDCNMVDLLAIACETEDNIVSKIAATTGIKVRMERIEVKDFVPTTLEKTTTIASPMQSLNGMVISTSDVVAFVREK
jgi:hypothetical protein